MSRRPALLPLLALAGALAAGPAAAAPLTLTIDLSPLAFVAGGQGTGAVFDVAAAARSQLGLEAGRWRATAASVALGFADDDDPLFDTGPLGYDGSETTRSAARITRDGRSGLVTFVRTTEYSSRGFENAVERALIHALGLDGSVQSASRQFVLGTTTPQLVSASWSGWRCSFLGCIGEETQRYTAERQRAVVYDGLFEFGADLGGAALDGINGSGRWALGVDAGAGDFWWRSARLVLSLEALPAAVPEPASWALVLLGGAALAARRRRR